MKVVINRCYGGFGLSDQAFEMLLDRKGIEWEKSPAKNTFSSPFDYYDKGHVGEDDHYLWYRNVINDDADRADPILVQIVEELGEKVNTRFSDLRVVDVPDDAKWYIEEYDGYEHVAEEHRTWR